MLEVNATGAFLVSQAAARLMIAAARPASIVSIASIAGKVGEPGLAHYAASKFALVGFTQALARELAPHEITVNAVCPGVVATQMIEELSAKWDMSIDAMVAPAGDPAAAVAGGYGPGYRLPAFQPFRDRPGHQRGWRHGLLLAA